MAFAGGDFKETVFGGSSLGGGTWRSKLRRGAWIAPSGKRIEFDCFTVERRFQLRGTMFEFDGVNEGYIQRHGIGSRQYPLVCIFSGDTHIWQATAFEDAVCEPGFGTLEHPIYGKFKCLAFGEVGRNNSFTEKINQSAVEVTFWTSTVTPYPTDQINFGNELKNSIDGFNDVAPAQYQRKMNLLNEARRSNAKSTYKSFLRDTSAGYRKISDNLSGIRQEIADTQSLVNKTIDVLIGQPIALARQAVGIAQAPSRALTGIAGRLDGYHDIVLGLISSALSQPGKSLAAGNTLISRQIKAQNDLHTADLFVSSSIVGAAAAVQSAEFTSKKDTLQSAESLIQMFEDAVVWRDDQFEFLESNNLSAQQIDTGESFQALQRVVAVATGRLVEISFSLFPERYVVLDRARTVLDLSAELYQRVDNDTIDKMISTNNLSGDEILEIPRGRKIVYYT